jgi:nicotinamidase-related amidase
VQRIPPGLAIEPARCALLIVDVQERLHSAMAPAARAAVDRNLPVLIELARRFGMPVVVSEQYPRGLGHTLSWVTGALASVGPAVHRFEKLDFSVTDAEAFAPIWDLLGRQQWIVTGMETHVCVYQTVRGLIAREAEVHVPGDAVASRSDDNRAVGLRLIDRLGATVTSTELVVFDALRRAGSDDFKALSRLIR